ncbi:MAG: DUF5615 family PIN-like protein [Bacteroidia bacterium]|nr:DUF5615 family PIN-like protein [Bacteroidia bacterium]MDW8058433.1 DUF5615 family PIN-like protein [Bacteroidia bacterium]
MDIIVDECVPKEVVSLLRSKGYRVLYYGEKQRKGASDDVILEKVRKYGAILITRDEDFAVKAAVSTYVILIKRFSIKDKSLSSELLRVVSSEEKTPKLIKVGT